MISAAVNDEIRDLLATGELSQRKIARRVGVSRATVGAIAGGKRPDRAAGQAGRGHDLVAPSGQPKRCPTCGGLVHMPCLLCRIRAMKKSGKFMPRAQRSSESSTSFER